MSPMKLPTWTTPFAIAVLAAAMFAGCESGQTTSSRAAGSPTVLEPDSVDRLLARAQFDRRRGEARIDYVADDVSAQTLPGDNRRRVTVEVRRQSPKKVDLIATSYRAVDTLLRRARARLSKKARVLVATYVDLDDMTQTGSFGRLSGELAASRLAQKGYAAVNLNVRQQALAITQQKGQFVLSRDIDKLAEHYAGDAVLVGTYTVADTEAEADELVYATLRLVDTKTHETIGAIDYQLPIGPRMERLLRDSTSSYVSENPF
jgi:hypothetical protein